MGIINEKIPAMIVSIIFVLLMIQFFFSVSIPPAYEALCNDIQNFAAIMSAFALLLGSVNIGVINGNKLRKRSDNWPYALLLLITFAAIAIPGLIQGEESFAFLWIYLNINFPVQSTVFSLLGFYIVSAAYRSFRARTWEASVLLVCGALLILWGAPLGHVVFPQINEIGTWFLDVPNAAGSRGLSLVQAIAAITIGLSIFLQKISAFRGKTGAGEG